MKSQRCMETGRGVKKPARSTRSDKTKGGGGEEGNPRSGQLGDQKNKALLNFPELKACPVQGGNLGRKKLYKKEKVKDKGN